MFFFFCVEVQLLHFSVSVSNNVNVPTITMVVLLQQR